MEAESFMNPQYESLILAVFAINHDSTVMTPLNSIAKWHCAVIPIATPTPDMCELLVRQGIPNHVLT
jgi:hypothetical protein